MNPAAHDDPTIPPIGPAPGRGGGAPVPVAGFEAAGESIGPYRLISVLGEGGFGVVWLAERREPIVQRAAIKVIKPGMDSAAVIARFEQERQALAVMDHPNIAKVIDAGTTPAGTRIGGSGGGGGGTCGRPYFVMEYVAGEPITAYCDRHTLSTRQRLELFIPVCEAVQHAHSKGLIHRDLKPSNILVTVKDGQAVPKVIDFGVAKAISQRLTEKTLFTEHGQLIGTPEYMSPEQAEMGALDIDTRTDVYSLGVLLYELLTGTLPFDPKSLRSAGFAEIQRIIREVDPPRPSTRLSRAAGEDAERLARSRDTRAETLRRELGRELEWIPLKAMRKDRTQRYRTAAEMADDARNYLAGRPLIAGPESAGYKLRKFLRRRRGLVAASGAVAAALVLGLAGTSVGLLRANCAAALERQARERESVQRHLAESTGRFLNGMLASIDPEKAKGHDVTVKEIVDDAAAKVGTAFPGEPEAEASLRETLGETYFQLARFREAREQLRRALELRTSALGPEHRETLVSQFNLGATAVSLGEIDEGKKILSENLASRRRVLGEADADTLATRSLLGYALQLGGDNEGALAMYREALSAQQKAVGATDPATLDTMASVADVLQDLGRLEEADKAAAELVEAATKAQGPDGAKTLQGVSIRASILKDLGRYPEAEAQSRRVVEARTRMYGPEHTQTLIAMNVLALTLEQEKKYDEQADLLRRASTAAAKTLAPDHPTTLTYLSNLARAEQLRGNLDEAERLMRQVLDARPHEPGKEDQPTLVSMNNLGLLLLDRHKPAEAEPVFRQMLAGIERVMPEGHWIRGQARLNIAECLIDQQRYDEAEPLMLAGYEVLTRTLPPGHDRITHAAESVAKLYQKWGKPEQEAQWRERAKPPAKP